tara:strand:- start:67 stop:240 length:174 start_codon:yes stop_codon:yes gene_type:complete
MLVEQEEQVFPLQEAHQAEEVLVKVNHHQLLVQLTQAEAEVVLTVVLLVKPVEVVLW